MLENLIYFSPMLVLLTAFFVLMFGDREEEYNCFRFSRVMLMLGLILTIIFYNKATLPNWTVGNKFSWLFDMLLYGYSLALLYPSRKWFVSMNMPAYTFCGCLMLTVLSGSLLNCSVNLALTGGCCIILMLSNYMMLRFAANKKETNLESNIYLFLVLISVLIFAVGTIWLYRQSGSLMYDDLRAYLEANRNGVWAFAVAAGIICVFLFLLAVAPLHFWLTETLGKTILPVFAYFIFIPIIPVLAGFIQLNVLAFAPLLGHLRLFYIAVALLSVSLGAIGACCGQNIYKILACSAVYHLGFLFMPMSKFSQNGVNSGFLYLFAYLLSMYGICVCLFGLKKKGEYLSLLSDFDGAAYKRPYISAMLTIFLFSLLGLPPFLGFLGVFSVLNYMAMYHHFYQLLYMLAMMLIVSYSYIQIVRNLYFDDRKAAFDRADSGIYTAILLIAGLMIVGMLQPHYLIIDFRAMLETIFS